jgi:murein DD-endopeptidase MepM/ murein hydrolase activator NlpD
MPMGQPARLSLALGNFLVRRRKALTIGSSILVFIALFAGSSPKEASVTLPAMGGAAFPATEKLPGQTPISTQTPEDRGLYYSVHRVRTGDTIGEIADKAGITTDSIVSFNNIQNTRTIQPGILLRVPSQAGILYTVKAGDTIDSIATAYAISGDAIIDANGLLSPSLDVGTPIFLPDARLPSFKLREINGDLFRWPVSGEISSRYGWRTDPFTGLRGFHNGLDIAAWMGSPIRAAMEGRVSDTGYSPSFGNYILIAHHSGYASFYGHLSAIKVRPGQSVSLGQVIGLVGNTGYSTGPHLHFTVFKNGTTVNPANLLH